MAEGSERTEDDEEPLEEFRQGLQERNTGENEPAEPAETHADQAREGEPDDLDQLREQISEKYPEESDR